MTRTLSRKRTRNLKKSRRRSKQVKSRRRSRRGFLKSTPQPKPQPISSETSNEWKKVCASGLKNREDELRKAFDRCIKSNKCSKLLQKQLKADDLKLQALTLTLGQVERVKSAKFRIIKVEQAEANKKQSVAEHQLREETRGLENRLQSLFEAFKIYSNQDCSNSHSPSCKYAKESTYFFPNFVENQKKKKWNKQELFVKNPSKWLDKSIDDLYLGAKLWTTSAFAVVGGCPNWGQDTAAQNNKVMFEEVAKLAAMEIKHQAGKRREKANKILEALVAPVVTKRRKSQRKKQHVKENTKKKNGKWVHKNGRWVKDKENKKKEP